MEQLETATKYDFSFLLLTLQHIPKGNIVETFYVMSTIPLNSLLTLSNNFGQPIIYIFPRGLIFCATIDLVNQ